MPFCVDVEMSGKVRALLKVSGETLSGMGEFGLSRSPVEFMVNEIVAAQQVLNLNLAIVIGGGNIIRGNELKKNFFREDTPVADYMGMLATMINCIGFKKILSQHGIESRVMTKLRCDDVCEAYHYEVALSHLEKGRIVILAAGNGMPDMSTDITMVTKAKELGLPVVLKGTKVDGIYTADPKKDKEAKFIPSINHNDYLSLDLGVIDFSAVSFARQNRIPIRVFNFFQQGNLRRALLGEDIGSVIIPT